MNYNLQVISFLFRGKNFIIKYEGCFKSGDSDCFVLEHFEHDRPEVIFLQCQFFFCLYVFICLFYLFLTFLFVLNIRY